MTADAMLWFRARRRTHRSAWGHPRPPAPPKPQPAQEKTMSRHTSCGAPDHGTDYQGADHG
ncbi:hypothetical protein SEA_DANTE_71 [Mycobacterium phage Dante]|uniref:Uncharacterized protein n=1 Tax=Mycobacterium phage Dante TaxID=1698357 RepID=A0A0K1Y7D2_9CAUD|nr:hypothetical protein AVV07_gp071 [Mycobacterium phage Dante]AKY02982.1 hypothetical protein SEA_DANTE_71 [Mycobacterium phage Dante]